MKKINILVIDPSPIIQIGFKTLFKSSSKFELIECIDSIYNFNELIKSNNIDINRKVLADLAVNNPEGFKEIVDKVQ